MKESNLIEIRTDTDHWYPAPSPYKGEDWPSVTTVLGVGYPKGVGFFKWLTKHPSWEAACAVRDAAGERGTNIHKYIEKMLRNKNLVLEKERFNAEQWWMMEGFFNWYEDYMPKYTKKDIEKRVYDAELKVAGTLDFSPVIDDVKTCVDFKTSSDIQISHRIQSTQYAKMDRAEAAGVLRVGARNERGYIYEAWTMESKRAQAYLGAFVSAKIIFHIERPRAAPKTKMVPKTLSLSYL